jgi:hypothetical protein
LAGEGSKSEGADNMEKLIVIILVSLEISIIGLKIAEVYKYQDHKKAWEEQHKKIGAKVPIYVLEE